MVGRSERIHKTLEYRMQDMEQEYREAKDRGDQELNTEFLRLTGIMNYTLNYFGSGE